jgi:tight adherence protein B
MPILLFLVLLVVVFSVVFYMTKPTKQETDLGKRLAGIDRAEANGETFDADILKREVYSDLPIIDAILRRLKLAANLDVLIKQADSSWTVGRVVFGTLVIFAVVAGLSSVWLNNIPAGLILGLVAANVPYVTLRMKRTARLQRFSAVLPDAIDLLARALRAGHAVTAAIEMVAREIPDPVGTEFRRVFEEQNFGLPIREALLNLAKRVPVADLQFMVTAMLVQKETGGNLAEVLDKAATVIRERSRLLGQLRIYTAQGRLTGWILGLLPFFLFGLMSSINPGYTHTLIDDPSGRMFVWAGLGLMIVGILVIRKIVDIKV